MAINYTTITWKTLTSSEDRGGRGLSSKAILAMCEDDSMKAEVLAVFKDATKEDALKGLNRLIQNGQSLNCTDKSGNVLVAKARNALIDLYKEVKAELCGATIRKGAASGAKAHNAYTVEDIAEIKDYEHARRVYNCLADYKSKTVVGKHAGLVDIGKMSKEDYDAEVADYTARCKAARAKMAELKATVPTVAAASVVDPEKEAAKELLAARLDTMSKRLSKADLEALKALLK